MVYNGVTADVGHVRELFSQRPLIVDLSSGSHRRRLKYPKSSSTGHKESVWVPNCQLVKISTWVRFWAPECSSVVTYALYYDPLVERVSNTTPSICEGVATP
jgi:hypothetical protein